MQNPADFDLVLVDPNGLLCDAFRERFSDLPRASVRQGYFQELDSFDCMVSAANSFGLMGGGVDRAIVEFFGDDLESRVRSHIVREFRGEQPVGTSFIIETGHPEHPFLAHTPTMRVAQPIAGTDNVYRAMQAMLLAVWNHNRTQDRSIGVVACPGLGTATGRLPYDRAANQMALAFEHFINPPGQITGDYAHRIQRRVHYGGDRGFEHHQRQISKQQQT